MNFSDDLIQEKRNLETELVVQKKRIQRDVKQIKDGLKPAVRVLSLAEKFTIRDHSRPLVNAIVETECYRLFNRSHFLVRLILPRLITNFASNLVTDAIYLKKALDYRKMHEEQHATKLLQPSGKEGRL